MIRGALAVAALLLASPPIAARQPLFWQRLIAQHDRDRLRQWRSLWVGALDQARAAGFGPMLDREGALFQPDAALDQPAAPDGLYRCRLFKLGRRLGTTGPGMVTLPAGRCRIADDRLDMLDGVQRPGGRLYPYDASRLLLLGGLALGDEQGSVRYGRDDQRDLLGLFERIGPARWRVAFPEPAWQSRLDVLELVPAPH